jgi:hypothetical protein
MVAAAACLQTVAAAAAAPHKPGVVALLASCCAVSYWALSTAVVTPQGVPQQSPLKHTFHASDFKLEDDE